MKYFELLQKIHDEKLSVEFLSSDNGVRITIRCIVRDKKIKQDVIVLKEDFGMPNNYLNDMVKNVVDKRNEILKQ